MDIPDHLSGLLCPTLIVQGTRDPFGTRDEVTAMDLPASVSVAWIEDGNHDLAPRKASGWTVEAALDRTAEVADHFLRPL